MTEVIAETEEEVRAGLLTGKVEKIDGFDYHAGRHWIYPINKDIRDYQYCIVHQALFNNTMVVLPTGLGKTLIAAVVMYNFYLWYPQCKIVFMAPTRPLVKQQMEACFEIVGIPREDIVELTGHTTPFKRQEEWQTKRLFFLTPQVMQNDLFLNDYCPAEKIKCIVVDEAHKATGGYAYTRVVEEVYNRNKQFRILALSATPGKDLLHIKQVLKNLLITKIEYRSEESLDVQKYTHSRHVETIVVQLDEELSYYRDRLLQIIEENLKTLVKRKAINGYDLNRLSSFYLLMQKKNYEAGQHKIPPGLLNSIRFTFAITTSLVYALDLLKNHGLRSFYNHVKGNRTEDGPGGSGGKKGFNLGNILKKNTILQEIMDDLKKKFEPDGNVTLTGDPEGSTVHSVPGHPKLIKLQEIVLNHIEAEGPGTRIMIFSQYRASVEEITCLLRQHAPTVRPVQFVGQSSVKRRGFSQKQQLEVINRFREGEFNVLVATCVAEEGLDIGNVDLIICYDANKSPIRLVQRMGRTGRAREGKIIVLATAGKEEEAYNDSLYNRKRVATNLLNGVKQDDLFQENVRLYPKGLKPICRKLHLGIRREKEQDSGDNSDQARENESNDAHRKGGKSCITKKRRSSTKEVTRRSVESTKSCGNTSTKKRKNRYIFQNDDGENGIRENDDAPISVDLLDQEEKNVTKVRKSRPPKTPKSESALNKKRKRKQKIDDNFAGDFDNTMELLEEKQDDEPREESTSASLNEIPKEELDEMLLTEQADDHQLIDSPTSATSSPERSRKKIKKSLLEEDELDGKEMSESIDEDNFGDISIGKNCESINEKESSTSDKLSTDNLTFSSLLKHETLALGSFSCSQIAKRLKSTQNKSKRSPKSVPSKKSKWSEFLSSDDSYDSLDYNPLEESPKEKKERISKATTSIVNDSKSDIISPVKSKWSQIVSSDEEDLDKKRNSKDVVNQENGKSPSDHSNNSNLSFAIKTPEKPQDTSKAQKLIKSTSSNDSFTRLKENTTDNVKLRKNKIQNIDKNIINSPKVTPKSAKKPKEAPCKPKNNLNEWLSRFAQSTPLEDKFQSLTKKSSKEKSIDEDDKDQLSNVDRPNTEEAQIRRLSASFTIPADSSIGHLSRSTNSSKDDANSLSLHSDKSKLIDESKPVQQIEDSSIKDDIILASDDDLLYKSDDDMVSFEDDEFLKNFNLTTATTINESPIKHSQFQASHFPSSQFTQCSLDTAIHLINRPW